MERLKPARVVGPQSTFVDAAKSHRTSVRDTIEHLVLPVFLSRLLRPDIDGRWLPKRKSFRVGSRRAVWASDPRPQVRRRTPRRLPATDVSDSRGGELPNSRSSERGSHEGFLSSAETASDCAESTPLSRQVVGDGPSLQQGAERSDIFRTGSRAVMTAYPTLDVAQPRTGRLSEVAIWS